VHWTFYLTGAVALYCLWWLVGSARKRRADEVCQSLAVGGLFGGWLLGWTSRRLLDLEWLQTLGWVIIGIAGVTLVTAVVFMHVKGKPGSANFEKTTRLVVTGPFAVIRHPIYAATAWWSFAAFFIHQSLLAAVTLVTTSVLAYGAARLAEPHLVEKFGPEYAAYAERVPRFNPLAGLWRLVTRRRSDGP
jgi:protein-S-isoprenylcysteine O-methyltransferase Ste14